MILAVMLASAALKPLPPLPPPGAPACQYERTAVLALDEDAFDQDMAGGWRVLSDRGCKESAADLIRDYRTTHPLKRSSLSIWHEGQMRADAGQTVRAIALFERARKTKAEDHGLGWNLYVDGSIAFLQHDSAALRNARAKLAALPKPAGLDTMKGPDGKPTQINWPLNLNVLDGFLVCFAKPYREAYARCAPPTARITSP